MWGGFSNPPPGGVQPALGRLFRGPRTYDVVVIPVRPRALSAAAPRELRPCEDGAGRLAIALLVREMRKLVVDRNVFRILLDQRRVRGLDARPRESIARRHVAACVVDSEVQQLPGEASVHAVT